MAERETCPQCGVDFVPSASPLGLCPACLLKLGASDPSISSSALPNPAVEQAPAPAIVLPAAPRRSAPSRRSVWVATAAVALVAATFVALHTVVPAAPPLASDATVRFHIAPP